MARARRHALPAGLLAALTSLLFALGLVAPAAASAATAPTST